jgi:hypothetical protein
MTIRILVLALVIMVDFSLSAKAQSSFTIDLYQDGANVVATGSGDFDLDGLTQYSSGSNPSTTFINASAGNITSGGGDFIDYTGFSGPDSFGNGSGTFGTSATGSYIEIAASSASGILILPSDYVSGTTLSNSAAWDDTTLSTLGVTPGIYTWTYGTDSEDSFTLDIVSPVPEPADYGWGVLLATLGFVAWRRFSSRATARA